MKRNIALLILLLCHISAFEQEQKTSKYREKYRPQFHFSTPENWINDPNGLVYFDGEYHLFFQHNPFGNKWGHMSWGHAVSKDLVEWNHLPIALKEENGIMIFSGTVVVDEQNSSRLGKQKGIPPLVAIYTGHREGLNQSQHLAYSLDKGRTWIKYKNNPLLDLGKKDFRDPKVFWYEPGNKWIMVVALPLDKKVQFYQSRNLLSWKLMSEFGPAGDTSGIWECPDLFRVPVRDSRNEYKWVLMLSPAPFMQYFVGAFDGTKFKNETPSNEILRPDYGPDYYAAIVYNQLPENMDPVSVGWVNNWNYANEIPASPWKGAMSLPRSLQLKKLSGTWTLVQEPVAALKKQRTSVNGLEIQNVNHPLVLPDLGKSWEIELEWTPAKSGRSGFKIGSNENAVCALFYDPVSGDITFERGPGNVFTFPAFEKMNLFRAPLAIKENTISLHVFFDHSIIEFFVNGGERVFTAQVFPGEKIPAIELFSDEPGGMINRLQAWKIKSVW